MGVLRLVLTSLVVAAQIRFSSPLSQEAISKIARNLKIYATVLENRREQNTVTHTVQISLSNYDIEPIPCCDWVLYFHSFFLLFPGKTDNDFPQTRVKRLDDQKVIVRMIQGDLYSIEPISGFGAILAGEWKNITVIAEYSSVSVSDFMPNWYITQKTEVSGVRPAIVTDTMTLNYVLPFEDPSQWKRYPEDRYMPVSPQSRKRRLGVSSKRQDPPPRLLVIPTPVRLESNTSETGNFMGIDDTWRIQSRDPSLRGIAQFLSDKLQLRQASSNQRSKVIILTTGNIGNKSEAYKITTDSKNGVVQVTGQDNAGLYYGVQSIISLLSTHTGVGISDVEIYDYPRFPYRGLLLDVTRNFHGVDEVKSLIRAMSMYKLNKMILHLTDDEGWRIEIQGLPELTEIGARRCHNLDETECIIPQLGSGPYNDTHGSGFYTEQEYKEILAYANARFIEVIPEIDAPGHAHAAIRAMETRSVRTGNDEFRLIEPLDKSVYISTQHWFKNVMNPCLESTYSFIDRVLTRIIELHRGIQPLKTVGIRGDEIPKGAWEESPECQKFIQMYPDYNKPKGSVIEVIKTDLSKLCKPKSDTAECGNFCRRLKLYFAQKMAAMIKRNRLKLLASEDLFFDEKEQPFDLTFNHDFMVVARRNTWEHRKAHLAHRLANHDYKVIMAQATHLYLDHPHEPDPSEPGLYWATRFTDTRKLFGFKPDNLFGNIDVTLSGELLTYDDVCGNGTDFCETLLESKRENIIGMQAHLWSETIRTSKRRDYMTFPRLLAFAERSWHKAKFEDSQLPSQLRMEMERDDWEDFANTLGYKELRRLDEIGIQYRIPPPGARRMGKHFHVCTAYPGLVPQYSYDDINASNKTWYDVDGPFHKGSSPMSLRTKNSRGDRYSRIVPLV